MSCCSQDKPMCEKGMLRQHNLYYKEDEGYILYSQYYAKTHWCLAKKAHPHFFFQLGPFVEFSICLNTFLANHTHSTWFYTFCFHPKLNCSSWPKYAWGGAVKLDTWMLSWKNNNTSQKSHLTIHNTWFTIRNTQRTIHITQYTYNTQYTVHNT